jgi:RNA 2',3'-cyclic 3'-phosphodiesterase
MSTPQYIRAFVAVELSDELKSVLAQAQLRLKKSQVSYIGRWVAPDSVHLTLKFLGDVTPSRVEVVTQALHEACAPAKPFQIALSGLGCFPSRQRPRVVWIGVTGDLEPLQALQRSVETALQSLGFVAERRPFQPHLTLARIKDGAGTSERAELMTWMDAIQIAPSAPMAVRELDLIRSELRPSGAVYTRLASFPLAG